MAGRGATRTQPCSVAQARTRLGHARKFLEVAELVAACCTALGRRSRGQDHLQAVGLVAKVEPGGAQAANGLRRLLNLKDEAHYGLFDVSGQDLRAALRQATALVEFAAEVVQRRPA